METFVMVCQFFLSLTLLVFIHELGHFLAARMFGTKVDKFYLFFDFLFPFPTVLNFSLFKKKIGDTEYGIGWFPLGGYVAIAGMADETTDVNDLDSEPKPDEYRAKKNWQKLIILAAGVVFNAILAAIIFSCILFFSTKQYLPAIELQKGGVLVSETANKLGFKEGDYILEVNGNKPERFEDLMPMPMVFGGYYLIQRNDSTGSKTLTINVAGNEYRKSKGPLFAPRYHNVLVKNVMAGTGAYEAGMKAGDIITRVNDTEILQFDILTHILDSNKSTNVNVEIERDAKLITLVVKVNSMGKLGFQPDIKIHKSAYNLKDYSFLQSIQYGVSNCLKLFSLQGTSISKMASGKINLTENLGGMIAIANIFGGEWDWLRFWEKTAFISMMLAFMNLLPIPLLDGGQMVIVLIEWIRGKPLPPKFINVIMNIGLILVLALIVLTFYLDIDRYIFNK